MAITPGQIDKWIQAASEHQNLEFKEAKDHLGTEKICEYCVAIANEGGGVLLLGISDKRPRQLVGTSAIENPVKMSQKLFNNLGFRVNVEAVNHCDGRVVVFQIPARPKGSAYHLRGRYLMRSGEELISMSEDRLRVIFDEGKPDWLEEHSLTGLAAQQIIDFLDTQAFFDLLSLPYPTDRQSVIDRLIQEHLIDYNNGYAIRRLGALLFAKQLDDFQDIARKAPRVIIYTGTSKMETRLDRFINRGYAVGFRELIQFIMSQLPQSEVIQNALRKEVTLVPEDAVRELVANSLIHQDFQVTGTSVVTEIYADRVEISNPGDPIVPVERFIDGYQSRNERLAGIMRRMRICEEKGSGIDKVIKLMENNQFPAPDFRTTYNRTNAVIFAPKPFEEMIREDRIRACYQHACLKWVENTQMTNQSLRDRFRLPENKSAIISQVIAQTLEVGLIKADEKIGGSRKFARYLPSWA